MNDQHGTDQTTRDIIARLHAQETELAGLRRALTPRPQPSRRAGGRAGRPARLLATLAMTLLIALVPMGILAANPFGDLTGGVHDPNIDLIYNAGITTGCVPNVAYCPTDVVTRQEMASFLARTAGLGTNPPVVNAKTAVTATNATTATTADNATKLGGRTTSQIVRTARNSDASAVVGAAVVGATVPIPVVVASVAITAPGPGYVLVNASGFFKFTPGCVNCDVDVMLAGSPFVTAANSNDTPVTPLARTWLVKVNAAGEVTLPLIVRITRPGQAIPIPSGTFSGPQLTALYVPFGNLNNGGPIDDIVNP